MRINRKPNALILALVVVIALLTIGTVVALVAFPGMVGTQVEDCDAEDFRNREKECGFVQPAKSVKPVAPAKTPAKPVTPPRITRR